MWVSAGVRVGSLEGPGHHGQCWVLGSVLMAAVTVSGGSGSQVKIRLSFSVRFRVRVKLWLKSENCDQFRVKVSVSQGEIQGMC